MDWATGSGARAVELAEVAGGDGRAAWTSHFASQRSMTGFAMVHAYATSASDVLSDSDDEGAELGDGSFSARATRGTKSALVAMSTNLSHVTYSHVAPVAHWRTMFIAVRSVDAFKSSAPD